MERLQAILARVPGSGTTFENMTPRELEQFKVDGLNKTEGNRHEEDGYRCAICKNKGYIAKLRELPNGAFTHYLTDCKCTETRRSIMFMKRSGLENVIKDCTFEKYEAPDAWQQTLKGAAMQYAKHPEGWFFLGGQSGSGKSHLCTAICREFLLGGRQVVYMLWRDDIEKLKRFSKDEEDQRERQAMLDRFKRAEVLYIDDLFKKGKAQDGRLQRPTSADIDIAFEVINYRYNNPGLLTIVSSEWSSDDLLDIDEATGGRIFEKAGANGFSIAPDRRKNYRTRKAVTI